MKYDELKEMYAKEGEGKKSSARHKSPELDLQSACNKWLKLSYPLVKVRNGMEGVWIKDKNVLGKLIKKGVFNQKGFPDVEIIHPNKDKTKFILFIELKDGKKGSQSEEQKLFEEYCNDLGVYQYSLVRSLDDFIKVVKDYLGENRITKEKKTKKVCVNVARSAKKSGENAQG